MDEIISILDYLVGSEEVDFEDIYNELIQHYPSLTKDELMGIALRKNLLSPQVKGKSPKLRRKSDKPVPLPPNQNPNQKR
ncbi:hypothetical protein [Bacteroides gallinarum]|uniref:hypothetical protein n=1 Tax=Bacteroides gallinarum TaxID=376806 RepID=UPI0003797BE7|nr:hypothetical protein [Bacteroides gallinarum]